ncbi:hypothetical protein [Sulfurimonas sp. HSL-1716]|uniref:hypothetical protein n=1 Tax=Hydrocurvibacter sulfurireducens TaxID=3131937 RepID=UPI0031F76EF7
METGAAYQNYLTTMQNYRPSQGRKEYQAPYAQKFEAIFNKAQEADVKLSNAKDFLQSLSSSELTTLQKYSGLADGIDINSLSNEGAYNLLMHDKEQFDFNNDGSTEVGAAKKMSIVPSNMPQEVKDAYISAMNSLSDKDRMTAMMLTFDPARLDSMLNGKPYTPTKMDYAYLDTQVQNHLNPKDGAYTSEEAKASITAFWNAFNAAYKGDKTQTADTEKQSDDVSKFLKDLHTKGAAQFLADLNMEKIEKQAEEYKEKLIKELGDSPEVMKKIEKLVADFKKKLLEEMQNGLDSDKKTLPVNGNALVQMILDAQQKQTKPLESLLAADKKKA